MNFEKFTINAQKAIAAAQSMAADLDHQVIQKEHLLLALLEQEGSVVAPLFKKIGADPAAVREALLGGFADSTILRQHGKRMIEGDFKPGGPAKYQLKDQSTAMALARDLDLQLPVSALVEELFGGMVRRGRGDIDHSGIFLELQRLNNLPGGDD